MQAWIDKNGTEDTEALIEYAYGISTAYGEAASALACEMYDAIAQAQGARVPPAVPAATATYEETATAVQGTLNNRHSTVPATAGRLAKQAGADTMLHNAARDGAEFAWIPSGDTCVFCLTLASRGWQRQSRKAARGHAEHIHANCNCQYAVRFDKRSTVAGYDPEKYRDMYESAEGRTTREKRNAMRRADYEEDRDAILARQRAAYARRQERERIIPENKSHFMVNRNYINSEEYRMKFRGITGVPTVDDEICHQARIILSHRSGSDLEDLVLINADTGAVIHSLRTSTAENAVNYDNATIQAIERAHNRGHRIVAVHNHPNNLPPTLDDGVSMLTHGYDYGIMVTHDGLLFQYSAPYRAFSESECREIHNSIAYQIQTGGDKETIWTEMLRSTGMQITRRE